MWASMVAERLGKAASFIEVSAVLCELARTTLDMHQSNVTVFGPSGMPAINVDDVPFGAGDSESLEFVERFPHDEQMKRLLAHHAAAGDEHDFEQMNEWARRHGYTGAVLHSRLLPLVEPCGLLGAVRVGAVERLTDGQKRDLDVLAAYASVQLVRLGVTAAPGPLDALTPAQQRVCRLVATGMSNDEIGDALGISSETIKKHLHGAFVRLGVHRRAQLAVLVTRARPSEAPPPGVSRRGALRVTTPRHTPFGY
jgi:DNA-binding CsgD family transcriptional regulator